MPLGEWVRVVGVYDGTTARLYQNGALVAEVAVPAAPPASGQEPLIGQYGAQPDPVFQFKGQIRNLALYARVIGADGV